MKKKTVPEITFKNGFQDNYKRGPFGVQVGPRGKHYKPKVMKRIKTHGLMTRLESRGGKQMLWRKIIQGPSGWVRLAVAP